jgi:hypothetical protein
MKNTSYIRTPSTFTREMFESICDRHAKGETLSAICRTEGYPHRMTFHAWCKHDEALVSMWADASMSFEEAHLDATLDISDDGSRDYTVSEDGAASVNHDHISRSKLRVDTRFKMLAIKNPEKYGTNRVNLNHGGQPDNPIRALLLAVNGTSIQPVADDGE